MNYSVEINNNKFLVLSNICSFNVVSREDGTAYITFSMVNNGIVEISKNFNSEVAALSFLKKNKLVGE